MIPTRILSTAPKDGPELIWKGKKKYPLFSPLPIKTLEKYGDIEQCSLYWGENADVLEALLPQYENKIDLIYLDPPFDSSAQYTKKISLKGEKPTKENSFQQIQYSDSWKEEDYLQFMYERLLLLHALLSPRGSLYLHCDMHRSHRLRMLLDEIFGGGSLLKSFNLEL